MEQESRTQSFLEDILVVLKLFRENHIELGQLVENPDLCHSFLQPEHAQAAVTTMRFMDEIPGGFLMYYADEEERILYANRGLLQIFQCTTMEEFRALTGNSFKGIVHPEDLDAVEASIHHQIFHQKRDLDYVEYRIIRKDGAVRWIEDYGHFVHSKALGDIFYVFLGDATEKKNRQLQEQALTNQEYLRRLEVIEGLSINYESILYADLDGNQILPYRLSCRTKAQFEEKFQTRMFDWYVSDYVETWVHPEDQELVARLTSPAYIREKLSEEISYYLNFRVIYQGELQYIQLRIVHVGSHGHVSQIVMGYRRVDEELQREMEQKQKLEEALSNTKLANEAKSIFLSNMSHDMRTPLNAIFGFTALVRRNLHNPAVAQSYLDRLDASSRQLLELIDKVLEISCTGSGNMQAREDECSLCSVMQEVYEFLKPQAMEKEIAFSLDCMDVRDGTVYSDKDKLKQLVMYLANNAITYTDSGGHVSLTLERVEELPNHYAIYRFVVTDTGIGISEDSLQRIFEPFVRERNTTLSGIHGAGLGLTIAKKLVDDLGGTIDAKSSVGQGSTFTITLRFRVRPQVRSATSDVEIPDGQPLSQRILLVEDNEINREIELELLGELGFSIDTAEDGVIAVEKVKSSAPNYYDLILMDIQMPNMDGWQAAKAIRALEDPVLAQIPIIALSANVFESDIRMSMKCGIDAHIAKPLDIPLLLKTMDKIR